MRRTHIISSSNESKSSTMKLSLASSDSSYSSTGSDSVWTHSSCSTSSCSSAFRGCPNPDLIGVLVEVDCYPSCTQNRSPFSGICATTTTTTPSPPCVTTNTGPLLNRITPSLSTQNVNKNKKCLSNPERWAILHYILHFQKDDGRLIRGALSSAARKFQVDPSTCSRIWKRYLDTVDAEGVGGNVSHQRHLCGRKKKHYEVLDRLQEVPLAARHTLKDLSAATGISTSTLSNRLKQGSLRRHSSYLLPHLTLEHKIARIH